MKTVSSFDISDAIQEGMNEFHKSCGYKISDSAKAIQPKQESTIVMQKIITRNPSTIFNFLRTIFLFYTSKFLKKSKLKENRVRNLTD